MNHTGTVTAAAKRVAFDVPLAVGELAELVFSLSSGDFPAGDYVFTVSLNGEELASTDAAESTALTVAAGNLTGAISMDGAALVAMFAGHVGGDEKLRATLWDETGSTLYVSDIITVRDNYQADQP